MNKQQIIQQLQLEPHVEGGYFRRTYASSQHSDNGHGPRPLMSSIFYLLTDDSPVGHLHRNRADILHYYQGGGPLEYLLVSPGGELSQIVMGRDLAQGQQLQLLVPGGYWKASRLLDGDWGLISEAVCPGFDYTDMTLADSDTIARFYPQLLSQLQDVIKSTN